MDFTAVVAVTHASPVLRLLLLFVWYRKEGRKTGQQQQVVNVHFHSSWDFRLKKKPQKEKIENDILFFLADAVAVSKKQKLCTNCQVKCAHREFFPFWLTLMHLNLIYFVYILLYYYYCICISYLYMYFLSIFYKFQNI